MKEYIMVLKTDAVLTEEQLNSLREKVNQNLVDNKIAKIVNVRPHEEVQILELKKG